MGVDVDTAEGDNGCADENEHQDDQHGNHYAEDLAADADLVTFPVDILWRGDLGVLDLERPPLIEVLLLDLVDTTTAHGLETRVQAGVEHVVVAVVA